MFSTCPLISTSKQGLDTNLSFHSHQGLLVVFHSNSSDNKSLQVSSALLGIFTDLSNVVVVSSDFQFLQSAKFWGIVSRTPPTIDITVTLMSHIFLVLWRGPSSFLFDDKSLIWFSGQWLSDPFLSQNPWELYESRSKDGFRFVHIPFCSLFKF